MCIILYSVYWHPQNETSCQQQLIQARIKVCMYYKKGIVNICSVIIHYTHSKMTEICKVVGNYIKWGISWYHFYFLRGQGEPIISFVDYKKQRNSIIAGITNMFFLCLCVREEFSSYQQLMTQSHSFRSMDNGYMDLLINWSNPSTNIAAHHLV